MNRIVAKLPHVMNQGNSTTAAMLASGNHASIHYEPIPKVILNEVKDLGCSPIYPFLPLGSSRFFASLRMTNIVLE